MFGRNSTISSVPVLPPCHYSDVCSNWQLPWTRRKYRQCSFCGEVGYVSSEGVVINLVSREQVDVLEHGSMLSRGEASAVRTGEEELQTSSPEYSFPPETECVFVIREHGIEHILPSDYIFFSSSMVPGSLVPRDRIHLVLSDMEPRRSYPR